MFTFLQYWKKYCSFRKIIFFDLSCCFFFSVLISMEEFLNELDQIKLDIVSIENLWLKSQNDRKHFNESFSKSIEKIRDIFTEKTEELEICDSEVLSQLKGVKERQKALQGVVLQSKLARESKSSKVDSNHEGRRNLPLTEHF